MTSSRGLSRLAGRSRLTALIVASAFFMEQLDSTALSTALPVMAHAFHVAPPQMNLALTAYLLSLAIFIPISGNMADRFGSRTIFGAAIVVFTASSVLCAQAETLPLLVGGRLLQGLGGAMMVPVGRLVLLRSVAKSELVVAMSWVLVPAMIGPVLGPPIGGFIVTYFSWHWIFYVNVPIGLIGLTLVALYVEEFREEQPKPFDFIGMLLLGICLACLIFGLEAMTYGGASPLLAVGLLGASAIGGGLYWAYARRRPASVLDLTLLRIPTFSVSVVAGTFYRIGFGAVPFLLPMMLQLGFGVSALQSGLFSFSSAIGGLAMKTMTSPLLRWAGFRNILVWNGALSSFFLGVCALLRPSWPIAGIYLVLLIGGLFRSLQFNAYGTIAYADVPPGQMSGATSFYSTIQQLSLTLGISISAGLLQASVLVLGHGRPLFSDFTFAFLAVAVFSAAAVPLCRRLDKDAATQLSGRRASALR